MAMENTEFSAEILVRVKDLLKDLQNFNKGKLPMNEYILALALIEYKKRKQ